MNYFTNESSRSTWYALHTHRSIKFVDELFFEVPSCYYENNYSLIVEHNITFV